MAGGVRYATKGIQGLITSLSSYRSHKEEEICDYNLVSVPESKRDSEAPPAVIVITKEIAAKAQLEAAIRLWFDYGEPVSIHMLAVGANDCYRAMAKDSGKPSDLETYIKTQGEPWLEREAVRVQNFCKHGWNQLKGSVRHSPLTSDILILDSIMSHEDIFKTKTHLMRLFGLRFAFENPDVANIDNFTARSLDIDDLGRWNRPEFLKKGLEQFAVIEARLASK